MKFTILGSGGAIRIPKACCTCDVCTEARLEGFPYKRLGQSLYLHDEGVLFDTPEDINEELNDHKVMDVKHIVFSHWHPDHLLGCRIIESIMDGEENTREQLQVHMPEDGIDLNIEGNSIFSSYENLGYIDLIQSDDAIKINDLSIEKIKLSNGFAYAFLIEGNNKKVLYCPCHTKHLPVSEALLDVDLFITSKGYSLTCDEENTNFERDTLPLIAKLNPKRTVITHIEETDKMSFDDYLVLERNLEDIEFAFDGMTIEV